MHDLNHQWDFMKTYGLAPLLRERRRMIRVFCSMFLFLLSSTLSPHVTILLGEIFNVQLLADFLDFFINVFRPVQWFVGHVTRLPCRHTSINRRPSKWRLG